MRSKQDNLLETIINTVPEVIFYKDKNGRYLDANKACRDFYAKSGITDIIGKKDSELPLDPEFIENCIKHDNYVIQTRKTDVFEEHFHLPDGTIQIFETTKTPVYDENDKMWGIVGVVRDITQQRNYEEHLKRLSYTDFLTGLYNRAYFNEMLKILMEDNQYPIGFILADVNGLKLVNDTLGHHFGDKLIKSTAELLTKFCPKDSFLFRWGGDEFVILIPNSNKKDCQSLINKILIECEKTDYIDYKISIALGSSLIQSNKNDIKKAMQEAEDKLYRRKMLHSKSLRNSILSTLQQTLATKNVETEEHTNRVLQHSMKIGEALNLDISTQHENWRSIKP